MAIQFIPLVSAIIGGAATVGVGVFAYKNYISPPEPMPPAALIQPATAPPEPVIEKVIVKETEVKTAQPQLPEFHILRVEKDGSAVIAGSAAANAQVEIMHGDKVIATAKATGNGDFAIVLDEPLPPGVYELYIRVTKPDGSKILSAEAGIISVPQAGPEGGEVIAMVTKPGAATKLIQVPEAKAEIIRVPTPAPVVEPKPEAVPKPVIVAKAEPVVPDAVPTVQKPVLLGAVEVEEGKLFVAGTGEPGRTVNIYIDDKFVGKALVKPNGSFLLESKSALAFGNHTVRADMLGNNTAQVSVRAQVPLIHDQPAPEPIIVAKAEPASRTLKPVAPEPEVKQPVVVKQQAAAPQVAEPPVRVIRTGSSVIIRSGDNLWRVSRRILGRGIRYSTIYNANKDQIQDPSLIFPGQIFKIPEKMVNSKDQQNG